MIRLRSSGKNSPIHSVSRWFLMGFLCFSLIFFIALLPLVSYCRSVFTELEINKSTQQMDFGINQLDNTVSTIINASQSIYDDHRFYSLHYTNADYSEISVAARNQMRDYLDSMVRPSDLIIDCALQLSADDAVTPTITTFGGRMGYYPFYFQVDDLSYEEWDSILQNTPSGFLPLHQITTPYNHYDGLIYSIEWAKNKYFYACLDITAVRNVLIAEDDQASYRLTIKNSGGTCLYTDLTDDLSDYHSVTQKNSSGNLSITVHIPNNALTERMKPLYSFLGIYLALCALVLIITILIGTHLSTRPLARIITTLENTKFPQPDGVLGKPSGSPKHSLGYGFNYIHDKIRSYENNLQQYQTTIDTQTKVLQARFIEKALNGSLSSDSDYEEFRSYFPDFPDNYRLILMGLSEKPTEHGNIYPNPMASIQYYLQSMMPHAYLQQLTTYTLLLIVSEQEESEYSHTVNHLIENINTEEPCYHAWGMIGNLHSSLKELPYAYLQMQDIRSKISTDTLSRLCAVSDFKIARKTGFQMSDTMLIYSAIIGGNEDAALPRLQPYADALNKRNRAVFEMFRSILLCIKQDYADLLIDIEIPFYQPQGDLFSALETCMIDLCQRFQSENDDHSDSFAEQVKAYIDIHFVDAQLCSATLEEQFRCSFSKIRKTFSKDIGIPISSYIEQKRMALANELLLDGEYSVSEIALKCGFTNYNSFFKVYQRTYGHAPTLIKGKKNSSQEH